MTVGTHDHGFNRLVQPMDVLAAELDEIVIIQRGSSTYEPRYAEHFQWASGQRMQELNREARVVVMHAAAGSILLALLERKAIVVVPRQPQFNECIDDHQHQLASALDTQNRAVALIQPSKDSLRAAIERAARQETKCYQNTQLVQALNQQLNIWKLRPEQPASLFRKG